MRRRRSVLAWIAAAPLLIGCAFRGAVPLGSAGAVSPQAAEAPAGTARSTLILTIVVPAHGKLHGRPNGPVALPLGKSWTSPGTAALGVHVQPVRGHGSLNAFFAFSRKEKACKGGGPRKALVCTMTMSVPSGRDEIVLTLRALPRARSPILGQGRVALTFLPGKSRRLKVATEGDVRSLLLWIPEADPPTGPALTQKLGLMAVDAWGFVILGRYAKPVKLTDSDRSGATQLSRSVVVNARESADVVLRYSGAAIAPARLQASSASTNHRSRALFAPGASGIDADPPVLFVDFGTAGATLALGGGSAPYAVATTRDFLGNPPCAGLVRVKAAGTNAFSVAPLAIGACSLAVSDAAGHHLAVPTVVQPEANPPGNPFPSPTPAPGAIAVQPSKVTICPSSGTDACAPSSAQLTVTQSGYFGSFVQSSDCSASLATVTPVSAGGPTATYTVTGGSSLGECTATFTGAGAPIAVTIDVTVGGWIINTTHVQGETHP